jgi:hypothetical protein
VAGAPDRDAGCPCGLSHPLLTLLTALAVLAVLASPAAAQQPAVGPPTMVDGPSPDILRPSGLAVSIARDGTGGLVYLKQVAGVPHVFVSQLGGGVFQAPVQVDTGLGGASSQPVIAAGNGGVLLIGFINGGELYVVQGSPGGQFGSPAGLASGAINPAIGMSNFGKAYLAFAVADGGGYDVRTAYYYNGTWALEGPPLNQTPADNAGTGAGRPAVAAAGDGVAIVVWGENGHIYSRRVWGTAASVVDEQADAPPGGCTEISADSPVVGAGGDSSFAPVAFHEVVSCGGQQQSRVLMNRLQASIYDGILGVDGLSGAPADGADDPQVAVAEYGQGWVTSERTVSHAVVASSLEDNGWPVSTSQVNSLASAAAPDPVPAIAGLYSNLIAWQQEPGSAGGAEIRVRYAPDGTSLAPEMVVSSPTQGPTDAADGLAAAGDVNGEAAVGWLQGPPGGTQLMVEQMYQPPGPFSTVGPHGYVNSAQPVVAWKRPRGWGPMTYSLSVDGAQVAQTSATSAQLPVPVADGPHSWQVTASNPGGQQVATHVIPIFVDTVPPEAAVRVASRALLGARVRATVNYADHPPAGEPPPDASGVATVVVRWGDRTTLRLHPGSHRIFHVYRRAGRYRVLVLVTDRAGNTTRVLKIVKVTKSGVKPQPSKSTKPRNHVPSGSSQPPSSGGASKPTTSTKSK